MHPNLKIFVPLFLKVIDQFHLTALTQFNTDQLVDLIATHFASALRQGETEVQFLERMTDLFTIGELVYAKQGFYPEFPNDDAEAFWAKVAQALLNETRDQLKTQGYLTGAA